MATIIDTECPSSCRRGAEAPEEHLARYDLDLWLDRGGTFTDAVVRERESGRVRIAKVPSEGHGLLETLRALLSLEGSASIPRCDLRLGTTLVTNLALEGEGAPAALLTTEGFADLIRIGDQAREDLFSLEPKGPRPLLERVEEVSARRGADGALLSPLREAEVRASLRRLREEGFEALAVVLLHGADFPDEEARIGRWARGEGFSHVALSHEVAAAGRFLERLAVAALDARWTPALRRWLRELRRAMPGSRVRVATSTGHLEAPERVRAPSCFLSGPAGGALATARWARRLGEARLVGLDMGGTSTDVVRVEGEAPRRPVRRWMGWDLRVPSLDVQTVAAGGGSVCRLEGGRPKVGPRSVGAVPGPICYGREEAQRLALTDVLAVLGRLPSSRFPLPLQPERALAALHRMASEGAFEPMALAEGFMEVALARLAAAVRRITVEQGADPRRHPLFVYGGAGALLACELADRLEAPCVYWPPAPGVLSAWGLAHAPLAWRKELRLDPPERLGSGALRRLGVRLDRFEREGRGVLSAEGADEGGAIRVERTVRLRYPGTEGEVQLPEADEAELGSRFVRMHEEKFGFSRKDVVPVLVGAAVEVRGEPPELSGPSVEPLEAVLGSESTHRVWWRGRWRTARCLPREALHGAEERSVQGPALLLDTTATCWVPPGWAAFGGAEGVVVLRRTEPLVGRLEAPAAASPDPVALEVFHHAFTEVADRMGLVLRRTAVSANVRERRDFSCGLFDARGRLVASAPHIPVHLGAMGETVRAVARRWQGRMEPADAFLHNDPAEGGTHLPDVTVVMPWFGEGAEVQAFVAARAHHADIGGVAPGSMPADSCSTDQEGVIFRGERLVHRGRFEEASLRARLSQGAYPVRRPEENVADLLAQVAACRAGCEALDRLVRREGEARTLAYMGHVLDDAEAAVREALATLPVGWRGRFEDALDDGTPLCVQLRRIEGPQGPGLEVDFRGSGAQHPGNFNAPPAVSRACVLYVLRCLLDRPLPLNEGCFRAVRLHVPPGSLLAPEPGAAVAGGNVETSQRLVDVLLGALGRAAASQGTMNNVLIGSGDFVLYETIGGGAGATARAAGASGLHTHMTNARITDPEVLERRFPLRLLRFGLRRGSGGRGLHPGGDGLVREFELLAPATVSLLTQRRLRRPYGLSGGAPGALGRNELDGRPLPPVAVVRAEAGARLRIETPGGGGWGVPPRGHGEAEGR